jgi:uroporphyrinogen III methyltransferase/synthase
VDGRLAARQPLAGRRVLVTRPRGQVARLGALLEAYGAEVVAYPTIEIGPPEDFGPLDEAIGRLEAFDWVIFTSANGVAAFGERLTRLGRDVRALGRARVATIGPETSEAARRLGLASDVTPTEYRAEGLVDALRAEVRPGAAILVVRAAEARDVLPRELAALGAAVTVVPAYRTRLRHDSADAVRVLLEERRIDVITFTSSSTVRGLVGLLPAREIRRLLAPVVLAAIGPITAGTLAEYGLEVRVLPREYTAPALADAIAAYFEGMQGAVARP